MKSAYVSACAFADWSRIFAAHGLPAGPAGDAAVAPERAPLCDFVRALEQVGARSSHPGLAWAAGQSADYGTRGQVGRAVLGSKTLGLALRRLATYFPLIQDATSLRLDVSEGWTTLKYKILDPDIWPRHEDAMYSLGIYAFLLRTAAPEAWSQVELSVEAEAGAIKGDLSDVVETTVAYGAPANMLRFPTALLSRPFCRAEPADGDAIARLSAALADKRRRTPMAERTREMIFSEMSDGLLSQEHIARELGVSSRTLRRKLEAENLSFQALLDECRMRVAALEFRARRSVSLSEVALKLGYSEHSTFSRAFGRWAGMAPQDYRRSFSVH